MAGPTNDSTRRGSSERFKKNGDALGQIVVPVAIALVTAFGVSSWNNGSTVAKIELLQRDLQQVEREFREHDAELGHPELVMDKVKSVEKHLDREGAEWRASIERSFKLMSDRLGGLSEVIKELRAEIKELRKK